MSCATNVLLMSEGDTLPVVGGELLSCSTGQPINLTGSTVEFVMNDESDALVFSDSATVENALLGTVSYQWKSGDTDTPGTYYAKFVVTFPGGGQQSFPASPGIEIEIDKFSTE